MNATKLKFAEVPNDYAGLVRMYPPRPIHDSVDERNIEELIAEARAEQREREEACGAFSTGRVVLSVKRQQKNPRNLSPPGFPPLYSPSKTSSASGLRATVDK